MRFIEFLCILTYLKSYIITIVNDKQFNVSKLS